MRGREVFMSSFVAHGVKKIFGNPGTTENPLLESLLEYPEIEYITALHEGVAVCAAGNYSQASGEISVANVHVAPGLGNAIGMMFGCLKSQLPVIITAGQQDNRMRLREPLLSHDLVAMAKPVTKWAAEPQSADEMAAIMHKAMTIATTHPQGPVFISLPNNVMEQETELAAQAPSEAPTNLVANTGIEALADKVLAAENIAICPGDDFGKYGASAALAEFVEATGADIYTDFLKARLPINMDHPAVRGTFPATAKGVRALLNGYDLVIAGGGITMEEVWYDATAKLPPECYYARIENHGAALTQRAPDLSLIGDLGSTMAALTAAIKDKADANFDTAAAARKEAQSELRQARITKFEERLAKTQGKEPLAAPEALSVLAANLPDDVVIVDESITAQGDLAGAFRSLSPDHYFANRGGGIGQGLAGALGTAVARPDAPVVVVSGDGSAMYSIQALWSAAHHNLNLLFVILANAEYRVLKHNLDIHRSRFDAPSDQPYPHMDLANPGLGFVDMASGMGVPALRAGNTAEIEQGVQNYLSQSGPYLLEIAIAGKGDS